MDLTLVWALTLVATLRDTVGGTEQLMETVQHPAVFDDVDKCRAAAQALNEGTLYWPVGEGVRQRAVCLAEFRAWSQYAAE